MDKPADKPLHPPMDKPKIAGSAPMAVDLEEKKTYYFCTCGLSATQPFCDGAHKGTGYKSKAFSAIKSGKASLCLCKHSAKMPFCDGTHKEICK